MQIIFDENVIFGPRASACYPILRATMMPEVRAVLPPSIVFLSDTTTMPLQAADLTAGLGMRTIKGENDEFDALVWKELEGVVNLSECSTVIDGELLVDDSDVPFRSAEEARMAWDALEAYLDTFGGDPVAAFEYWAKNVKASRRPPDS